MMLPKRVLPLLSLLPLAACTLYPPADQLSSHSALLIQHSLRAPGEWNSLAKSVAKRIAERLREEPKWLAGKPIFVAKPVKPTAFNSALQQFLISQLTTAGVPVSSKAEGALTLDYDSLPLEQEAGMSVVINASISNGSTYLFRFGDAYTISADDRRLYEDALNAPPAAGKKINVVGG